MARQVLLFFLIILISFVVSFDFDDGDDFFDDIEDSGDKRGLDNHGSVTGDGETVFASESKNKLTDGRETITKEWVKWLKDPKTGKWSKKRTARHFMRLKNGTVVEMEDNGSGDTKPDGEMTKVDCINEDDCKEEQFCDFLSYACKDCLKINQTCHKHKQCCKGSLCREGKCEAITGKEGDPCESDKDCKTNHCCAYDSGREVCQPYLEEGEVCGESHHSRFPSFFANRFLEEGKRTRCPCLKGLKCEKKRTFFLYHNQVCMKHNKQNRKKHHKKSKKVKKIEEEENGMKEMESLGDEMNFLPEEAAMEEDEMIDHGRDEMDDDNDDNDDDLDKRSLMDGDDIKDDETASIFDSIPKMLKGFVQGILGNFE